MAVSLDPLPVDQGDANIWGAKLNQALIDLVAQISNVTNFASNTYTIQQATDGSYATRPSQAAAPVVFWVGSTQPTAGRMLVGDLFFWAG